MEIGPISGVGLVPPLHPEGAPRDLAGVFRVEFQREQQDSYSPHGQSAGRGLEDEEDSPEDETGEAGSEWVGYEPRAESGAGQMSFFA